MPSVPADRVYVDGALDKLREEVAREIQRLDARLNSVVLSNNNFNNPVDVELVNLASEDPPNFAKSTELNKSPPGEKDPNADAVDITASGSATMCLFGQQEDAVKVSAVKAAEPQATESQDSGEVNMVCFDRKSAWSLPLVLTSQSVSDSLFSVFLLLLNVAMQILFTSILLSPSFLGHGFDEQVEGARVWRRSSAHDAKNMDLAQRSLATRVCHEDDSLIFSTGQAALVGEINSFLVLSTLQFDGSTFEPGVLLAVLCILLWNLCIYREFRSIWFVLQGIFLSSGASERPPPSGRRAAAMAFVCLGRAAIGGSLLVAGSLWLAGTTSITEFMLNSVALEAVLHVDEFIFSGLLPTRLQQQIQELPPVKVRRARRCHRAENLVLASLLCASLLLPYALLLRPLSQQMLLAKRELCFGDLDFVTSVNDGLSLGFVTCRMEDQANPTISEIAAVDLAFRNKSDPDREHLVWLAEDLTWFSERTQATLEEYARETSNCYSADDNADYSSALILPSFVRMAAFELEQENVTSCQDMEQFCDSLTQAGTLLRMACPRVCGCTDPLASPLLRVKKWGCFHVCIQEAYGMSLNPASQQYYAPPSSPVACRDAAPTSPGWVKFWDGYLEAASAYGGFDYTGRSGLNPGLELFIGWVNWAKEAGCPALLANPVDVFNIEWCRGNPALFRPLAWFCPETCGCSSSGNLERDRFCFGYDHCPVHVAPNDTVAFWGLASKYDLTKVLVVH